MKLFLFQVNTPGGAISGVTVQETKADATIQVMQQIKPMYPDYLGIDVKEISEIDNYRINVEEIAQEEIIEAKGE